VIIEKVSALSRMTGLDDIVKALSNDEEAPWRAAGVPPAAVHEAAHGPSAVCASGDACCSLDVDAIVGRAVRAQHQFATWNERQIDGVLERVAESVALVAEDLARSSVDETGMGNARDKSTKICFASRTVQQDLRGRPAAGILYPGRHSDVVEIASPVGVVLGLIPVTNPIATLAFKTLIALKGRNALIASCHHRAQNVGRYTTWLIREALRAHGAPADLVQLTSGGDRARTARFMRHPDVSLILATGGSSMVKEAYSSGTPTIGVGPGNAPAWICADADIDTAAKMIVSSKSFDNGIICGSENHLIADSAVYDAFVCALQSVGAAVLDPTEAKVLTESVFDSATGSLRRELVGKTASEILVRTGLWRKGPVRIVVAPLPRSATDGPWGREKLAPILPLFRTDDRASAITLSQKILARHGRGHTAIIHSRDDKVIREFGLRVEASRILVNSPASQSCIGIGNGLRPSLTLGSGTMGGTSTTDNVTYTHLLNIRRIAFPEPTAGIALGPGCERV
jgi:acetaldehyde dehydrogenase/alcohol dehydrogenase